jgi:hypothetical protein
MPSRALRKFQTNMLVDVDRIIETHGELNPDGPGRRGLGHLTRAGVLLACAAWELYLEELLRESVRVVIELVDDPAQLPKPVQKEIAKAVRESKHELKPLELAGDGWTAVYEAHAVQMVGRLNTPKSTLVDPLYESLVGIGSISSHWPRTAIDIDTFVSVRGDIAHSGSEAGYVTIADLRAYRELIVTAVRATDNAMSDFIRDCTGSRPWNRRRNGSDQ